MLVKFLLFACVITAALWLLYLVLYAIYNHFFNARRRDIEELDYHADRLETLLNRTKNEL